MRCATIAVMAAAMLVAVSGAALAAPVGGTFDSRTDSSIVVGPYDFDLGVGGFWEDVLDSVGFFTAWGHPQWNIEAWDAGYDDGAVVAGVTPVPEPATMALVGLGLGVLVTRRRRSIR